MQLKVMEQVIEFLKLTDVTELMYWKLPVSQYFATLPGEAGAAVG